MIDHHKYATECLKTVADPNVMLSTKQIMVQVALVHALFDISDKISSLNKDKYITISDSAE